VFKINNLTHLLGYWKRWLGSIRFGPVRFENISVRFGSVRKKYEPIPSLWVIKSRIICPPLFLHNFISIENIQNQDKNKKHVVLEFSLSIIFSLLKHMIPFQLITYIKNTRNYVSTADISETTVALRFQMQYMMNITKNRITSSEFVVTPPAIPNRLVTMWIASFLLSKWFNFFELSHHWKAH
jgi:hypothetical protein